ncbi:hypothetical protein [Microcoleus sp. D3_18a_C4]|uniref:hypothetical protein n=1 Tax=unclassified Microcoleus TaxID=2642155 RepID=UPI002FD4CCAE
MDNSDATGFDITFLRTAISSISRFFYTCSDLKQPENCLSPAIKPANGSDVRLYDKINCLDIDITAQRSTSIGGLNCHPAQIKSASGYFPIIDRDWLCPK